VASPAPAPAGAAAQAQPVAAVSTAAQGAVPVKSSS
jgi:hypothetical protein